MVRDDAEAQTTRPAKAVLRVALTRLEPLQGHLPKTQESPAAGIFVGTNARLEMGEPVELEIVAERPPDDVIAFQAHVVRVVKPIGVALEFDSPDRNELMRLNDALRAAGKDTADLIRTTDDDDEG